MRISDAVTYATCEWMAADVPLRQSKTNIAAYVGSYAHAIVAAQPEPPLPESLSFDATSPTLYQAQTQGRAIAKVALDALRGEGWEIIEQEREAKRSEFVGHLDLICWKEKRGEAVIDLKTGRTDTGWLQVGGYIDLLGRGVWGGILNVQRRPLKVEPRGHLELRPARDLVIAWRIQRDRIREIVDGARPTRSPGPQCGRCRVSDCAVRAH